VQSPNFRRVWTLDFLIFCGGGLERIMKKYVCAVCGFVYDEAKGYPDQGIAPGTKFEDVDDDFMCPMCGAGKAMFDAQ
jgi:rubredoxin